MKRFLFILAVAAGIGLTYSGAEALLAQVNAADGLKSSVITFVLTLGFALLGPAFLAAAIFFNRRSDSRSRAPEPVPETPKAIFPTRVPQERPTRTEAVVNPLDASASTRRRPPSGSTRSKTTSRAEERQGVAATVPSIETRRASVASPMPAARTICAVGREPVPVTRDASRPTLSSNWP